MKDATPKTIYLRDYQQPPYWIENIDLAFELGEEETQVHSRLMLKRIQPLRAIIHWSCTVKS